MRSIILTLCLIGFMSQISVAQEIIDLYGGKVPNSKEAPADMKEQEGNQGLIRVVLNPTLEAFLPDEEIATGEAVIICPGGGYAVLVYEGEGVGTAKEFARQGVAAFVLKYRIPNDNIMEDKKIGPLQDALQAIKIVRENADKYGVDPKKVGIMGFSAGGHLASTAATHYNMGVLENKEGTNLRPDFAILVYPVISMQDNLTHPGSKSGLLGENPSQKLVDQFSNEMQVDENTPPTYLTHAADDKLVDVDNSISFFESLRHHNVPVEMHIYPKGDHGFILRKPKDEWVGQMVKWMNATLATPGK